MRCSLVLSSLLLLAGCASIMDPGPDKVLIESVPSGASVTLDSIPVGETPVTAIVDRRQPGVVAVTLDGRTLHFTLDRHMSGWIWGNLLFGGIVGVLLDAGVDTTEVVTEDHLRIRFALHDAEAEVEQ